MTQLLHDLYVKNPLLVAVAWIHIAIGLLAIVGIFADQRILLGINLWIKPLKFALSIALFLFTLAILLSLLPDSAAFVKWSSAIVSVVMLAEIILICTQSIRGLPSHFNVTSPLNGLIFYTMGIAIVVNTIVMAAVCLRFFSHPPPLSTEVLWSIRFGFIIFILGSIQGYTMIARMAHSVGVPDGGPGLPFVNWSTQGGDLRIAHFLGLHSLQVLPIGGLLHSKLLGTSSEVRHPMGLPLTLGMAGLYVGIMTYFLLRALDGKPLVGK